jgi:DNA-3-methyladenine glycosylase
MLECHGSMESCGSMQPLPREFYARSPIEVARDLIGKHLICHSQAGLVSGRIVETEAYLSARDRACHANRGMTRKNEAMFGPPGHAYVYMIHAKWCLNAVTEEVGLGSAVLLRAIEPLEGIELMRLRRGREAELDLARGPGRLTQALAVDKSHNHWDLTLGQRLWIAEDANGSALRIARSGRIGISAAQRRLLRFYAVGNRFVSGRRR